ILYRSYKRSSFFRTKGMGLICVPSFMVFIFKLSPINKVSASNDDLSKFEGEWKIIYSAETWYVKEAEKNKIMDSLNDRWNIGWIKMPGGKRLFLSGLDITDMINYKENKLEVKIDIGYSYFFDINSNGDQLVGTFSVYNSNGSLLVKGNFLGVNLSKLNKQNEVNSDLNLDGTWDVKITVTKWYVPKDNLPQFSSGSLTEQFEIKNNQVVPFYKDESFELKLDNNNVLITQYARNASSLKRLTYSGIVEKDGNFMRGTFSWQVKADSEAEYRTYLDGLWTAEKVNSSGSALTNDGKKDESDDKNPFIPKPISNEDASKASNIGGILAGFSYLISLISSFVKDAANSAGTTVSGTMSDFIPNNTTVMNNSNIEKPIESQNDYAKNNHPIGTRREDGKIYTKNHGWQNEFYPELQVNSIKNVISKLESDIQRYSQNNDKLRLEIAKDELKRNLRELKAYEEDTIAIKRAQTFENEERLQNSAKRWSSYADELETAENVANTISFASDIALSIGTAGVSTALTSCKATLESLSLAKEIAGAVADGIVKKKDLLSVVTEFGVNKTISKGVSKVFDLGKEKYKIENAGKALKALVASAESSASNIVQGIAQDTGLTDGIVDKVKDIDNHFKEWLKD
ncbi:hypothetical protein M2651_14145, partial [Clostridium sp. SYSU_GA19001]|uniref:hypothetical protein n=1 Tax=Clostridium caldaquaticum TaxID=2940653 RepID=UPI002076F7E2